MGAKREMMSRHLSTGISIHPASFHMAVHAEMKSMCIMTSVMGYEKCVDESRYLLNRMITEERKIHWTIR